MSYYQVQGLQRGLEILHVMNRHRTGIASVSELAKATGIHRTTIKRLLATLCSLGLVQQLSDQSSYGLTRRVRELSSGFREASRVTGLACEQADRLTRQLLWPCLVTARQGGSMTIQYSTHSASPLAFQMGVVGAPIALLESASGRAWLAFCPEQERAAAIQSSRDADTVALALDEAARQGYAAMDDDKPGLEGFGAIAAPITHQGRAFACLTLVFAKEVLSLDDAVAQYTPHLRAAVKSVEDELRQSDFAMA